MSADITTVQEIMDALSKLPPDALVVGYGIDGWMQGEKLDGAKVYTHSVKEGGDGFIPITPGEEVDPDTAVEAVVITPCPRDLLIEWCFDDD